MRARILLSVSYLCFSASFISLPWLLRADDSSKASQPKIYDASAIGDKQVANATAIAKRQHKHILLQFGANTCASCLQLDAILEDDQSVKGVLSSNYVPVLIDGLSEHNSDLVQKYGVGVNGMPFLVVLDDEGKLLTARDTTPLRDSSTDANTGVTTITAKISPVRVVDFLEKWRPGGSESTQLGYADNPTVRFVRYNALGGGLKQAWFEAHNSARSEIVCKVHVEEKSGSETSIFSIPADGSKQFSCFVRPGDKPEIRAEVVRLVPVSQFGVPMPNTAPEPTATAP